MSGPLLMGFPKEALLKTDSDGNRYGIHYLCEPKPSLLVAVNWWRHGWSVDGPPFADVYDLSGLARRWVEEGLFRRSPLLDAKHNRVDDDPVAIASAIHLIAQKYK